MRWAFDADVLIYAAAQDHPLGRPVRAVLGSDDEKVGSVLLLPELLSRPLKDGSVTELQALRSVLGRLDLLEVTRPVVDLATSAGAAYGLKAIDAVHLATGMWADAAAFLTNNTKDFPPGPLGGIEVITPADL